MSEQEVATLTQRSTVTVSSEVQEAAESANLIVLRKARKALEAKFDGLKKPFKEGLEKLKVEFDAVVNPVKQAEGVIAEAILAWKRSEAIRIEKEKAAALAAQRKAEQEAVARRAPMPVPASPPVQEQAKGWQTDHGTMTTRKVPKWRVVKEEDIPLEMEVNGQVVRLWVLNEGEITRLRRGAGENPSPIPGIEFYYDEGLNVR